jgi:DNA-binding NtrC family response regulator
LSEHLKQLGCRVVLIENHADAFQIIESAGPCVIILAMEEPESQHIDFVRALKGKAPENLVMVVVKADRQAEIVKVLKKDVEDFITEPVQTDVLEKALARAFEKLDLKRKLRELQEQLQNRIRISLG